MMNYVVLSVFGIAVLAGLIGFGLGHRRQNWGTVAAAFLVLLTATGYVYLASRLAAYEWTWEKVIRAKREQLSLTRDALRPDAASGGVLKPAPTDENGNPKPLDRLFVDRERWQRALDRVNTWRGRSWQATFQPPGPDDETSVGVLEIVAVAPAARPAPAAAVEPEPAAVDPAAADPAADPAAADGAAPADPAADPAAAPAADPAAAPPADPAAAPAAAPPADPAPAAPAQPAPGAEEEEPAAEPDPVVPINPGATVYIFDNTPLQDGGRYVGAFLVRESTLEKEAGRYRITVARMAPADSYDKQAWAQAYESVTVYEDLPVDRWLAFYETPRGESDAEGSAVSPQPIKSEPKAEKVASDRGPLQGFLKEFERHETVQQDPESWKALEDELEEERVLQGEYWAAVTFQEDFTFTGDAGEKAGENEDADKAADESGKRSFQSGDKAEFDLQTARGLEAKKTVVIDKVFYRRPLRDGLTLMHGSWINVGGPDGILADGISSLLQSLQREIAALQANQALLERSRKSVDVELVNVTEQARLLKEDMAKWERDAKRAALVEAAFRQQVESTRKSLADTEREIVRQGRELSLAMGQMAAKIDAASPAPGRGEPPAEAKP